MQNQCAMSAFINKTTIYLLIRIARTAVYRSGDPGSRTPDDETIKPSLRLHRQRLCCNHSRLVGGWTKKLRPAVNLMRRRACRISRPRRSPPVDFSLCVRSWRQLHAYGPWDADSDVLECRPMTVVTAGLHGLLRCTSSVASVQSPDRGVLASLSSIPVGPFISIFVYA